MTGSKTQFAPPERASGNQVQIQTQRFATVPFFGELLHYVPDMVLILNRQRQVVYANKAALQFAKAADLSAVLGLRPGELFGCKHSAETEGGCGTTVFCRYCGGVKAVLQSQEGDFAVDECRLTVAGEKGEEALDLRVWASPITLQGEAFTFYAVVDIADEKRRRFLEKIFLHDIMNTATALRGISSLLQHGGEADDTGPLVQGIAFLSDWMTDEIASHRQLVAAENGELEIDIQQIRSRPLLESVLTVYQRPELLNGRQLQIAADAADVEFESDQNLLRRVLGNMVKNAIEGSAPGELVTMGCRVEGGRVLFPVHNPTYIPENIQLQMFNRSFSTKGAGRGLGTYSMKYLTEKYLGGTISFVSTEPQGTTFVAEYPIKHTPPVNP